MGSKNQKGFSLVEIIVVVSITILLSTIAVTYNRSSERQLALYKDQSLIVGALNRAKALAIQKYRDPAAVNYETCAFGLHMSSSSRDFILFQDLGEGSCFNANSRYDATSSPAEGLEVLTLDPRVEFVNLPAENVDILFIPPELKVTSTVSIPVTISLMTLTGGLSAGVTVDVGGQIVTD